MAEEDKFELKLELSLKRIAMVTIAQKLWKSPDITSRIDALRIERKIKWGGYTEILENLETFQPWEDLIDVVLNKVTSLRLPEKTQKDLQEIAVMLAERIYSYYGDSHSNCRWCISSVGENAIHNYYFSSYGILKRPCALLHRNHTPKNDEIVEYFHTACWRADEEIVHKYQNEIIAHLESLQSGLSILKEKEDVVFNIICVWNYIHRRGSSKPERVPKKFLKNVKYIIPLKTVFKMIQNFGMKQKVFHIRQNIFLASLPERELWKLPPLTAVIDYAHHPNVRDLYFALQVLSQNEMSNFFVDNSNNIILSFLHFWPYLELVPQIIDFYLKKNLYSKLQLTLEEITMVISLENQLRHSVKKPFYLNFFRRIWFRLPYSERLNLLTFGFRKFMSDIDFSILELNIEEGDIFNRELISQKFEELLKKDNVDELMVKFVGEIVIPGYHHDYYIRPLCSSCETYLGSTDPSDSGGS